MKNGTFQVFSGVNLSKYQSQERQKGGQSQDVIKLDVPEGGPGYACVP